MRAEHVKSGYLKALFEDLYLHKDTGTSLSLSLRKHLVALGFQQETSKFISAFPVRDLIGKCYPLVVYNDLTWLANAAWLDNYRLILSWLADAVFPWGLPTFSPPD